MTDVRLIDANALIKTLLAYPIMSGGVLQDIEEQPTIDYAPVRRGYWVHCAGKSNLWYCSECGGKILYNPTRRTYNIEKLPVHEVNRFCRNCGAKMDGGKMND